MNHPLYKKVVSAVEENKLEEAVKALLEYCRLFDPEKETAIRLLRANLNELKKEALLFGNTTSIREQRNKIKLQLLQLAASIKPVPSNTVAVDKESLITAFRAHGPEKLILMLFEQVDEQHPRFDQLLLIEQAWKAYLKSARNQLATSESLTVQRNQVAQQLLDFVEEM